MKKIPLLYVAAILLATVAATWWFASRFHKVSEKMTLQTIRQLDSSLMLANETLRYANRNLMEEWEEKMKRPELGQYADRFTFRMRGAIEASNRVNDWLEQTKQQFYQKSQSADNEDEYWKSSGWDVGRTVIESGLGVSLRDSLKLLAARLRDFLPENDRRRIGRLPVENALQDSLENEVWLTRNFRKIPDIAAIALITKYQNDVLRSGNIVAEFFRGKICIMPIVYDRFEIITTQNCENLFPGQTLEIKAGLGSIATKLKPTIIIGGEQQQLNEMGIALYKTVVNTGGTIPVSVSYKDPNTGMEKTRTTEVAYTVGKQ